MSFPSLILPERLVVTRDLTRTRHEDGDELARMRVEHEDDSRAREDMDLATGTVPGVHEALADDVAETHRLGDAHNALMAVARGDGQAHGGTRRGSRRPCAR